MKILENIRNFFKKTEKTVPVTVSQEIKYIVTDPLPVQMPIQNNNIKSQTDNLTDEDLVDTVEVVPVDEIEKEVLPLVLVLNKFPGIYTTESCGGHKEPKPGQMKEGSWMVVCKLESQKISALHSLEQLVYIFNHFLFGVGEKVSLTVHSREVNPLEPGSSLMILITGEDIPTAMVAEMLEDNLE